METKKIRLHGYIFVTEAATYRLKLNGLSGAEFVVGDREVHGSESALSEPVFLMSGAHEISVIGTPVQGDTLELVWSRKTGDEQPVPWSCLYQPEVFDGRIVDKFNLPVHPLEIHSEEQSTTTD